MLWNQILFSDDELVTQKGLLARIKNDILKKGIGPQGKGVTLEQLGILLSEGLRAYGVEKFNIETEHKTNSNSLSRIIN